MPISSDNANVSERNCRVCIIVLGDFGRSPRMQYHAISLAKHGFLVDVVAYKDSEPYEEITLNKNIQQHPILSVPKFEKYFPRMLVYVLKTLWQSIILLNILLKLPRPEHMLLQNPPSIPTLPVAWFVCWLRSCKLVIDWHNYGYTILGLSIGNNHILVKLCRWCEKCFGRKATKSICVTKAMKDDLQNNWNVRASVFYDCPPEIFHPITIKEKHSFYGKLSETHVKFRTRPVITIGDVNQEFTMFTKKINNKTEFRENRPALIVSSTSWTEDEDFSVLLEALDGYDEAAMNIPWLPHVMCVITGKGPLKSYYEQKIQEKNFNRVEIITLWLKAEDYPILLASADLGVCLHTSSSGLDLPMKVVDMFGSSLPVCAMSYKCLGELVKHGVNGLVFQNSKQLCEQLKELLSGFPTEKGQLHKFRENLLNTCDLRWEESWQHSVLPLFL